MKLREFLKSKKIRLSIVLVILFTIVIIAGLIIIKSISIKENVYSCKSELDCILGEKCGYMCYNKNFQGWYDTNVNFCMYRPVLGVTCKCINNLCTVEYPSKTEITIEDLITNPDIYVNKTITVIGVLRNIGPNYYTSPHFVLQDENLNNITVTAWAPLEYALPPPGSNITTMPKAMSYWLNKKLRVTGIFKYFEGIYYISVFNASANVEILTTCVDSDGGINYYEKGFTNPCPCSEALCPTCGIWVDICLNETTLLEYSCDNLNGEKYNCPYGCVNGACLKAH